MKKKILAMIITIMFICMLLPSVALAATTHTVSSGTFYLNTTSAGDIVQIAANATVTLTGTAPDNVQVQCGERVDLTLDNVRLNCTNYHYTALVFTKAINVLRLIGESYIKSGRWMPGVRVAETSVLIITGAGKLNTTGGLLGAGIGGGVVHDDNTNRNIPHKVGTVTIKSGTVIAKGGAYAAGIGGGFNGHGGTITISGGTVTATGGNQGAGIGGGRKGNGGTITIKGGIAAAERGRDALHDIGSGYLGAGGTLSISGDAAILLRNNACVIPTTTTHERKAGGWLYGVKSPVSWTPGGVIISPCTLSYHANGATGSVPQSVTLHKGIKVSVESTGNLKNNWLAFKNWNTNPAGTGAGYAPGSEIVLMNDTTLYAVWMYQDVASITLDQHELNLTHHDTVTLVATLEASGTNKDKVVWYSNNYDVASVDQSGVVTAVGIGNATITAYADGKSDTCNVTVAKKAVTSVTITGTSSTMTLGDTMLLDATILPDNVTYSDVTWISNDSSIVEVDSHGMVTALGIGSATITASADGKSDTYNITVTKKAVTSVTINGTSSTMTLGNTMLLDATILPDNATYKDVTWISNDSSVATVDSNGLVSAVGIGEVTIGAEVDGVTDSYDIKVVKNGVTSVILNKTSHTMKEGEELSLNATISPNDATNTDVSWRSSDGDVAIVNRNGVVTAVGAGNASIRAEVDGVIATCKVVVEQTVMSVSISNPVETMTVGDKARMYATITPSNASELLVTWSSKDESIVRVDTSGNVTAVGEGMTSIVLTVDDMSDACAVVVNKEGEDTPSKEDNPTEIKTPNEPEKTDSPQRAPEKKSADKKTVIINVQDLPEGTKAIKISGGEVIPIKGDEVEIEIDDSNGAVQIIALDDEEVPLGYLNIQDVPTQEVENGLPIWVLLLGVLIGVVVTGGVLCVVFKKKLR